MGKTNLDEIEEGGKSVPSGTVQSHVADVAAPVALTSSQAAALTSAQLTGGESPTEAEHNALQADVAALRTAYNALQVDVAAIRTKQGLVVTAVNGIFDDIEDFNIRASS